MNYNNEIFVSLFEIKMLAGHWLLTKNKDVRYIINVGYLAEIQEKRVVYVIKQNMTRTFYYITGLLVLALGITLNTKSGLGVSPIISVPYSISAITHFNFGNMTLLIYCIFVVVEFILKGKNAKLYDILQIPLSIVFTRFLNLFSASVQIEYTSFWAKFLLLIAAIILTGVGAAMSLNMRMIPNPGDGIVQAIADFIKKEVGFTKNCFDVFMVGVTVLLSFLCSGHVIGIGLGTILAMLGVGRTVSIFNHLCKEKMSRMSGLAIAE